MTRIAFRLAVAGGRESAIRLAITAVGVALGVALMLVVVSLEPAIEQRGLRAAQRQPQPVADTESDPVEAGDGQTLMAVTEDWYRGRELTIIHLAAGGDDAPVPVGLPRLPDQDEVFVSPAVRGLLESPAGELLRPRLAGEVADVPIGRAALVYPDELVAWVGWSADEVSEVADVAVVDTFPLPAPTSEWWSSDLAVRAGITLLAIALLLPVLVLVGVLTRLGAAQRDRRVAVLHLIGATPTQTRAIAAVEAVLIAAFGSICGWGLFILLRPLIARISLAGAAWFPSDFTPPIGLLVAVLLGVPLVAGGAAVVTLRRVISSPLGVEASETDRRRSLRWPATLLAAGLTGLLATRASGDELASGTWTALAAVSLVAILIGLPTAGPWLLATVGQRLARTASAASTLLAGRRHVSDPAGAFRASSGVMLGVFVATIVYGYTAGNLGTLGITWTDGNADVVVQSFGTSPAIHQVVRDLDDLRGVTDVLAQRRGAVDDGLDFMAATCEAVLEFDLAELNACPAAHVFFDTYAATMHPAGEPLQLHAGFDPRAAATTVEIQPSGPGQIEDGSRLTSSILIDPTILPADFVTALPVGNILLHTDGHPDTLERIRNTVVPHLPTAEVATPASRAARWDAPLRDARRIVTLAVTVAMSIAAVSLIAATVGRLLERRRPFTLLRATGVPLTTLFASVLVEAVLPLALAVTIGAALGLLAASALVAALGGTFAPPLTTIAALAMCSILAGLILVAATFPMLTRATRPQTLRTT